MARVGGVSGGRGKMEARSRAVLAQRELAKVRAAKERQRGVWAIEVATVIAERDELSRRAGQALGKLLEDGLDLTEAVAWTGGAITVKEARALLSAADVVGEDGEARAVDG